MTSRKRRILIVDMDSDVLISMEHLLEDEGFDTTTTRDMYEAFALLGSHHIDLVVIGHHPPEVSSEQLLQKLRGGRKRVPCLVMQSVPQHPFEGPYLRSLGACAVVPKSKINDVVTSVPHYLRKSPNSQSIPRIEQSSPSVA